MFLSPLQVIGHLAVQPRERVADFGTGNGEYAFLLSQRLQGEGALYAFDVVPELIERVNRERMRARIDNFFSLCADLNQHIPLKDRILHCAVLANTLHALYKRELFLQELHRVLDARGRVLFVDWASSFKNMGPRSEEVIAPGDAVRLFQSHGFQVGKMLPAGSHHYAFIATKA